MPAPTSDKLSIRNGGPRRVIIGAPAKSKGGGTVHILGTKADEAARSKLASTAVMPRDIVAFEGDAAKRVSTSPVFQAMKDRLGLQVA